jgi:uncharacterized damage-inducible protein DinB
MNIEDLCDAWCMNNALNLELLKLVKDDQFDLKPGKGKTIRSSFVHIIGVRKMWLSDRMKKESESAPKLDWKTAKRKEIISGLNISSELMQQLFRKMEERAQSGKGKPILKFFAYCIAHEAHHRSQIEIAMRINNCEPDEKSLYHLWEWEKIKTEIEIK